MLRSKLLSFREYITPVSNASQYIQNGTITPNEFITAGNFLTDKFVTWKWNFEDAEISEKNLKIRTFLPKEKQFLITRKVVCYERCQEINASDGGSNDNIEVFDEANNVWIVRGEKDSNMQKSGVQEANKDVDESEYGLEEEELDMSEDTEDEESLSNHEEGDSSAKRYYDLFILYSTSYKVPKLYLVGYNSEGQPLTPNEMLEDVSPEYRKKTATIEDLPAYKKKVPSISIHPCRHGDVMKLLMGRMRESSAAETGEEGKDEDMPVDSYLVIFLKFMNSVVPTMQYDFTMDGG